MGEIPHQKALVERLKDEPFAIVGVNTDDDKEQFKRMLREYGVTWRSSWQGSTDGPLPAQWGISSYPTVFVLDKQHAHGATRRGREVVGDRFVDCGRGIASGEHAIWTPVA